MGTFVTLFGYNLSYFELFGSIFNLVSIFQSTKAKWISWINSIIGQIFFFFLFWNTHLFANAILQIYYTYVCVVGMIYWKKTDKENDKGLKWLTNTNRFIWSIVIIISIFLTDFIIRQIIPSDKLSANLLLDITVTVLSVIGVYLLSMKYIDSWFIWMITDVICVFLFGFTGIYLVMLEYIVIAGLAVYGLINWIKIFNNNSIINN
jgi:nicotinamide mononucleotide transporter